MLNITIKNEYSKLKTVVLGIATNNGPTPIIENVYDPKSLEHILAGTYPIEEDMIKELECFNDVFNKYGVEVLRPEIIENCNQIFTRDIGFVIDETFIIANILPNREKEIEALKSIINQINPSQVLQPPKNVHIEGGDVILHNNYIFIGTYKGEDYSNYITARTNMAAVSYIKNLFPNKTIKEFDLIKSKTSARDNALHLDCCFQPLGMGKGIIYRNGFRDENDYEFIAQLFGKENLFHINNKEMYQMSSNIFSIDENVVVSEKNFIRLNRWLRKLGFTVEEILYSEISKQEGLLRCSTLPLIRN